MKLVGIGIGAPGGLTIEAFEQIRAAGRLVLQTDRIPLAALLRQQGISFETLDAFYERAEDFDELVELAQGYLRGLPDATVCLLGSLSQHKLAQALCQAGAVQEMLPGVGYGEGALGLCAGKIEPGAALICPALELEASGFTGGSALAVTELDSPYLAAELYAALSRFYAPEAPCFLVHMGQRYDMPLFEMPSFEKFDYSTVLVLDKSEFQQKACYDFGDFCAVIGRLRGENGCPWDREQTHESLRACLIEECYEVLEAIQARDEFALCDELGDVLLQVVMHAAISSEHGQFDVLNVIDGVCRKMIRRHPHIFGDGTAKNSEEVLKNWDAIKRAEKSQESLAQSLLDIPRGMPALIRAEKLQKKAAHIGFDPEDEEGALEKVRQQAAKLLAAQEAEGRVEEQAGDLLFSVVNLLRRLHIEAEPALLSACQKFADRIAKMENFATGQGKDLAKMPLAEQKCLWDEVKKCKKS